MIKTKKKIMSDLGVVLDKRITIEHKILVKDEQGNVVKDSYGNQKYEWVEYCRVWSEVRDLGGKEFFASMGETNKLKTKFKIHYRDDISTDMRIRFNDVVYNITTPDNLDYSKKWLLLIGEADV